MPSKIAKAGDSAAPTAGNVSVAVMPSIPLMATPVLPLDKIRALQPMPDMTEEDELQDIETVDRRSEADLVPVFQKRAAASILEVFYDLWVTANLGIFMKVHDVGNSAQLWSYIGYISIVWFNRFILLCFEVRYATDSIFERFALTLHLGVLVGFTVVAPKYDPEHQVKSAWQSMSLILMASRLVLAVEYATVLWHIRKFKQGKLPLLVVLASHLVAASIYLGVSFTFHDSSNSQAYNAFYVVMAFEAVVQLGLSYVYSVLSFEGTHLAERMSFLTMFILGQGAMVIMDSVVNVVKNNGWSSSIIGVLISGVVTVYFVFMLYKDWTVGFAKLVDWQQLVWSILHYPFHVFLLLFIKGSTQFLLWWKVTEVEDSITYKFDHAFDALDVPYVTSADVVASLNQTIQEVWQEYKPVWSTVEDEIADWLGQVNTIPDAMWNDADPTTDPHWSTFSNAINYLRIAVVNSVFGNFGIDAIQGLFSSGQLESLSLDDANQKAYDNTTEQFYLVFQYVFACAGMALITMTLLYILIKRKPTSHRNAVYFYVRTAVFFLLGIGLSLVTLVSLDDNKTSNFLFTPWMLPTLCFVFLFVIILTHVESPSKIVFFPPLSKPVTAYTQA
ncbi:uncharacterized protein B0I36DRAFT_161900 [Microdochium trichocladiopsis]|uniref:Bacterial low temperature requirement A protein-domain-containing protein n=1 Tax=Microdochium trichocladiopsis TaxID=1682393 RepID=A0A9P8XWZ3_9PEZI|nr:uncharacterized protein B0I36DRAFT_161900 [Microdochium trichocladiopsis]KAH7024376.1 hypothetical protein B0I36DRAFT_161900 [Microdochium trichocladiopsis]